MRQTRRALLQHSTLWKKTKRKESRSSRTSTCRKTRVVNLLRKSPKRRLQSSRPRSHSCRDAHPRRRVLPPRPLPKQRLHAPKAPPAARRLLPANLPVKRSAVDLREKVLSARRQLPAAGSQDARAQSKSVRKKKRNVACRCNKSWCCTMRRKRTKKRSSRSRLSP